MSYCDVTTPSVIPVEDNDAMDNDFNDIDGTNDEVPHVVKGGLRASLLVVEE